MELNASQTAQLAELAPVVDGKPDESKISRIDLENLAREYRTQKIIFETARDLYDQMKATWQGSREYLVAQLVRLVEEFIRSDKIQIVPALFYQDDLRRRLLITLNMTKLVQHLEGDSLRKHREAGACVRSRPSHPVHRRHDDLVHRQALCAYCTQPHQCLRL